MSKLPLIEIIQKFEENNQKLAQITDTKELIKLLKEQKILQIQNDLAQKIQNLEKSIEENNELLEELETNELEMIELTKQDNSDKKIELEKLEQELLEKLAPRDSRDSENIFLEIRAGAGGDESCLFAGELLRMYVRFCEEIGLDFKIVSFSGSEVGGYKEIIAEIRGEEPFSWFKYEGGVHRVQRVPATEKQGRVHTSTVSVAIMPLLNKSSEFKLDMKDVEISVALASGNGGQSVNTTYSAVRMRHIPTGLEAQAHEKSQIKNREKSLEILTSRVFQLYEEERLAKEADKRKQQVGRADRSEKIRTYNFPQDRLTDHRYNKSWNQLPVIMDGGIKNLIMEIKKIEAEKILQKTEII
jgi:peptide chain release factor 1